jgi:thymidylate synthase
MIINGWCANQLDYMALPPCHVLYVFSVNPETKELNCHMTQRSVDSFLGAPFNIASTALLTILFAKTANLSPGEIFWTGTDCHVYNNHIDAVKLQIARTPFEFPTLKIAKPLEALEDILTLKFEDLALSNYRHHPAIKAEMAV